MRRRIQRPGLLLALLLGWGLAGPASAEGRSDAGSRTFEVIVVRGAGVSRVTGSSNGVIREEVLRKDPHPARPRPKVAPPAAEPPQVTVLVYAPQSPVSYALAYPLFVGDRRFDRHGLRGGRRDLHARQEWRTAR